MLTTATFISTAGLNLEAIIEVNGQRLTVMDELSHFSADTLPKAGEPCVAFTITCLAVYLRKTT